MSNVVDRLRKDFRDPEYRHVYDEGFLNSFIATQLKVLREERGWTQEVMAERAGVNQSRVSQLEDVNFSSWTIRTLRKFAIALDLRLKISFEEFGTLLQDFRNLNRTALSRHSFLCDPEFQSVVGKPPAVAGKPPAREHLSRVACMPPIGRANQEPESPLHDTKARMAPVITLPLPRSDINLGSLSAASGAQEDLSQIQKAAVGRP